MNKFNKKIEELIADYLSGDISESNFNELEKLAEKEGFLLNDFVKFHQQMDQYNVPETSQSMDDQFYNMLKEQKELIGNQPNRWVQIKQQFIDLLTVPRVPRMAYGFILLLIGALIGNLLIPKHGDEKQIEAISKEMSEMRKTMVLSMIEGKQATDRIMAVSYVNDMDKADNKVIDALFKTLNNDENVNVRLASLDALLKFSNQPLVRKRMIESLKLQESPIVLMELASVLIQLQDKNSLQELKNLLKKENLDPNLRLTIEEGIKTFI
jgi:hypothetical protein